MLRVGNDRSTFPSIFLTDSANTPQCADLLTNLATRVSAIRGIRGPPSAISTGWRSMVKSSSRSQRCEPKTRGSRSAKSIARPVDCSAAFVGGRHVGSPSVISRSVDEWAHSPELNSPPRDGGSASSKLKSPTTKQPLDASGAREGRNAGAKTPHSEESLSFEEGGR